MCCYNILLSIMILESLAYDSCLSFYHYDTIAGLLQYYPCIKEGAWWAGSTQRHNKIGNDNEDDE